MVDGVDVDGVDPSGVDGVAGLALESEAVTASFIPPEQWPAVPQMKYRVPAFERVILVFWSLKLWMELLEEQAL